MLLAGKPILQIPLYLEQQLTARAVKRCGAGLCADGQKPNEVKARLAEMLQSEKYAAAARRFAKRHVDFDPRSAIDRAVETLAGLVTREPKLPLAGPRARQAY